MNNRRSDVTRHVTRICEGWSVTRIKVEAIVCNMAPVTFPVESLLKICFIELLFLPVFISEMIRNVPPDFLRPEIAHNFKKEIKKYII